MAEISVPDVPNDRAVTPDELMSRKRKRLELARSILAQDPEMTKALSHLSQIAAMDAGTRWRTHPAMVDASYNERASYEQALAQQLLEQEQEIAALRAKYQDARETRDIQTQKQTLDALARVYEASALAIGDIEAANVQGQASVVGHKTDLLASVLKNNPQAQQISQLEADARTAVHSAIYADTGAPAGGNGTLLDLSGENDPTRMLRVQTIAENAVKEYTKIPSSQQPQFAAWVDQHLIDATGGQYSLGALANETGLDPALSDALTRMHNDAQIGTNDAVTQQVRTAISDSYTRLYQRQLPDGTTVEQVLVEPMGAGSDSAKHIGNLLNSILDSQLGIFLSQGERVNSDGTIQKLVGFEPAGDPLQDLQDTVREKRLALENSARRKTIPISEREARTRLRATEGFERLLTEGRDLGITSEADAMRVLRTAKRKDDRGKAQTPSSAAAQKMERDLIQRDLAGLTPPGETPMELPSITPAGRGYGTSDVYTPTLPPSRQRPLLPEEQLPEEGRAIVEATGQQKMDDLALERADISSNIDRLMEKLRNLRAKRTV